MNCHKYNKSNLHVQFKQAMPEFYALIQREAKKQEAHNMGMKRNPFLKQENNLN